MDFQDFDPQVIAAIVGGLVGIAGSALVMIVGYLIKDVGRITVNPVSNYVYFSKSHLGTDIPADSAADADKLSLYLELDLYNSADAPRSLREIKILIRSKDKKQILSSSVYVPNVKLLDLGDQKILHHF
jgi:hypothetical protein